MKQGLPWSIKGIDPDARDVAKSAAKRDGLTLGAWMTKMIFQIGQEDGTNMADSGMAHSAPADDPDQVDMNTLVRVVGILIQKVEQAEAAGSERSGELAALMKNLSGEIGGLQPGAGPTVDQAQAADTSAETVQLSSVVAEGVADLEAGPELQKPEVASFELDEPAGTTATAYDEIPAITEDEAEVVLSLGAAEEIAAAEFEAPTVASSTGSSETSSMDQVVGLSGSGRSSRVSLVIIIGGLVVAGFAIPVIFPDFASSFLAFVDGIF